MIAQLTISRYGPLLNIGSKIYFIIIGKKRGWTKYDFTVMGELTPLVCVGLV